MLTLLLVISLAIILAGAELFTNAIEWLGKKLKLSEGAVGSILAAVGTALPETMIFLMAFFFSNGENASGIGIGAILGAPFMLATAAMGLMGISILILKPRRYGTHLHCDLKIIKRDLLFFMMVYSISLAASFAPEGIIRQIIVLGLVISYFYYAYNTIKDGICTGDAKLHPLFLNKKNPHPSLGLVLLQTGLALAIIVVGAHIFINNLSELAYIWGIPAFVLSLIIAPVATELPEKFNSILWIIQGKDTLAMGNITGAMVFQSSLIPALGIALTPWELSPLALVSGVLALTAASIVYFIAYARKRIGPAELLLAGSLYLIFIALVIYTGGNIKT